MTHTVYIGSDHRFTLPNARDADGTYLNAATVTSEVKTTSGASLASPVTPSFAYTAASDGTYTAVLTAANTNQLTAGSRYRWWVTFNGGTNKTAILKLNLVALDRER